MSSKRNVKITKIAVEACSKIFQGLLKALEQGNKMFLNLQKVSFLKSRKIQEQNN